MADLANLGTLLAQGRLMDALLIGGVGHGDVRALCGWDAPPRGIDYLSYDGAGALIFTRYTYLGVQYGETYYYGVV